jgi:hypothetical protein
MYPTAVEWQVIIGKRGNHEDDFDSFGNNRWTSSLQLRRGGAFLSYDKDV